MATAAEILARRLHAAGCRYAFGIPGGEVLTVMTALHDAGIRFELCKHENAGGFMAEGSHHVTGAPGILVATLGPGVANAVNVVANAYQDQVPMLFLTGRVDDVEAASYTHQVFDHSAVLAPITKASLTLVDGAVSEIVDKALSIARWGRPGPVHIDVPISVANAVQAEIDGPEQRRPVTTGPAPGADWQAAREAFATAERPLMIAGVGVLHDGAEATVAEFCQRHAVPLITTYKAKGVLAEDHPLALGGAGLSPLADDRLLALVAASDCVVLAGYDPILMRTGWRNPWATDASVIEFATTANDHYMHQAKWNFICDSGAGLAALTDARQSNESWTAGEIEATKNALKVDFRADEVWGPAAIVDEIQQAAPRDVIATVDSGAHRILLSQVWQCYQPRGLLQSTALCTMGCALPLATGAKLAAPERTVIGFMGDAGLEMVMGELATLRDLKLNVIVVVFVDRSLALIEKKQREGGGPRIGVDFGATDFVALAAAMGGRGFAISSRPELASAMVEAQEGDGFSLLACEIGENAYDGRF